MRPGDPASHADRTAPVAWSAAVGRRPLPGWCALWRRAITDGRQRCQARRARVLAYPDLAAALTAPLLGYPRPEAWNGYVPPKTTPDPRDEWDGGLAGEMLNRSPRRRALVDIASEALRREQIRLTDPGEVS